MTENMKFIVVFLFFITVVKSESVVSLFQNYTKWKTSIRSLVDSNLFSAKCSKQFDELFQNSPDDLWDFFDSTSKFPWSGLAVSSYADFGNYRQCMKIKHIYPQGRILGKYCVFGLVIPTPQAFQDIFGNSSPNFDIDITNLNADDFYKLSICIPDACTSDDFNKLVFNLPLFNNIECQTQDDYDLYTEGDIAILIVLGIFVCILTASTAYDVYLVKTGKRSAHPLLLAFSVYSNARKILATSKKNKEQIQIFNGIKSISIAWIIAGHGMNNWLVNVSNNKPFKKDQLSVRFFYISAAQLAVDSFFYMAGFLLAYLYMKQKTKPLRLQLMALPYSIIHRYIRLTPALAMVYFFQTTIFKHMNATPVWTGISHAVIKTCRKHWLSFFFYGQNYVNYDDVCLVPTWYLSVDMQLFIVANIILIPLSVILAKNKNNFRLVMGICVGMNICFTFLPLATKLIWPGYNNPYDTHSRVIDYTIGITMGIYIREKSSKYLVPSNILNLVIWTLALVSMSVCGVLYQEIIYSYKYSQTVQSLYFSFSKPVWCLGLSWITYSCYHGHGGIVNWILSRPLLQVTAKLSYCMYLVHEMVQTWCTSEFNTRLYFSHYNAFKLWCAFYIITLMLSFIWTLSFESPLVIIEKFIFGGKASPKKQKKSVTDNNENKIA